MRLFRYIVLSFRRIIFNSEPVVTFHLFVTQLCAGFGSLVFSEEDYLAVYNCAVYETFSFQVPEVSNDFP
jgi:hypothetical protein